VSLGILPSSVDMELPYFRKKEVLMDRFQMVHLGAHAVQLVNPSPREAAYFHLLP
jgi:hypothetical protein